MNPFILRQESDKDLFSLLAKINKKGVSSKVKLLKIFLEDIDKFNIEDNIGEVVNVILPCMNCGCMDVERNAFLIMRDIQSKYPNVIHSTNVIPALIIFVLNSHEFNKQKEIIKPSNIHKYKDSLLDMISFEDNRILFYRVIIVVLRCNESGENVTKKICEIRFDSEMDIKYGCILLRICDENCKNILLEKIRSITKWSLIDAKWKLLIEYSNFINNVSNIEIEKESRFLSVENIQKLIDQRKTLTYEDNKDNFNNIVNKSIENDKIVDFDKVKSGNLQVLNVVLPLVRNKIGYLIDYINAQLITSQNLCFNILHYITCFKEINKMCDVNKVNSVFDFIEKNKLWGDFDKNKTLLNLNYQEMIIRAFIIRTKIESDLDPNQVKEILICSLEVLTSAYFKKHFDFFIENQNLIISKFPSLLTMDYLQAIIKDKERFCEIIHLIDSVEMKDYTLKYLKEKYRVNDLLFIANNTVKLPKFLKHFLYYNLYKYKELNGFEIDSAIVFREYFKKDFIMHLIDKGKLDIDTFLIIILDDIMKIEINNTVFYSSLYFYSFPEFYEDIRKVPFDGDIYSYINSILTILCEMSKKIAKNGLLQFLILLVSEILGKDTSNIYCVNLDITVIEKVKGFRFADKILFDRKDDKSIDKVYGSRNVDLSLKLLNNTINRAEVLEVLKLNNKRMINLLIENYETVQEYFSLQISHSNKEFSDSCIESIDLRDNTDFNSKYSYFIDDTNYLTNKALEKIALISKNANLEIPFEVIEKDHIWENPNNLYIGRQNILNSIMEKSLQALGNEFSNIYNLTRFEENVIETEVFDLITSGIDFLRKSNSMFAWNTFLKSIEFIRNINIIFFFEKMVKDLKYKAINEDINASYAFNFPNLMNNKVDCSSYIERESRVKVSGITTLLHKKTKGYILKVYYAHEETNFECIIEIDNYDIVKTHFNCNHFKKDLITAKISNLLKKSRRFMEIISLWKVNIDRKMEGTRECVICYLIVNIFDNSFPDFKCEQCENKFHKKCMSQWINKSGSMTCPLCRKNLK